MSHQETATRMDFGQVVIANYGSQYTPKLAGACRKLGMRSVTHDPGQVMKYLAVATPPKIIVLSGGPASVNDEGAPRLPTGLLAYARKHNVRIVGICYGMQLLAKELGGAVANIEGQRRYGAARIRFDTMSMPFQGIARNEEVWASHGDTVQALPPGFKAIAWQEETEAIAAMRDGTGDIFGVQFHPEVEDTPCGMRIIESLLVQVGRCIPDWKAGSIEREIRRETENLVGADGIVVAGMSGGVDSTVTAKLMSFLGDRLHLITIDGGQLRENELAEIERHAHAAGARLSVVNAKDRFLSAMGDATDAKTKRERFSGTYGRVFAEQALALGAKYFAQGTLAPDMIESGETGGAQIKKHHNVGLVLPGIKQFHPLARFFKNEVRALAQELGLPASVYEREPFPGPGNYIRLPGLLATAKNLETVAWGQARTREILERHGLYREISLAGQLVVAYGGPPTVGVKGDARAYHPVFMVRPVRSADFMTSRPFHLPDEVEDEISAVLSAHASATRCFFDYTTKPPATTEFE